MRLATEEPTDQEPVRPPNRPARLGGTDIFRGALVIITAIVIGGFVISRGLDQGADDQVSAADETETAAEMESELEPEAEVTPNGSTTLPEDQETADPVEDTDTSLTPSEPEGEVMPEDTTPEAPLVRPPAEVKVLVLNGAQTRGIAARGTETLLAASYQTAAPKNARTERSSAVLYAEGFQVEAVAVANVFGPGLEGLVQPIDPADLPIDDIQGANVIVVIGNDDLIPIQ